MTTIIIVSIIGFLIVTALYYSDLNYGVFNLFDLFLASLMGLFGGLIGAILGFFVALCLPTETVTQEKVYKIESLQDNNSVRGAFFLGCGQINGTMKYVFYYEEGGLYRMKQIEYEYASIRYADSAKVTKYYQVPKEGSFINNFSLPELVNDVKYIIDVPKGTILNSYKLDAE